MTLLEAIQHDLNNGPTRDSIKNGAPTTPSAKVTNVTLADMEAIFARVEKPMQQK